MIVCIPYTYVTDTAMVIITAAIFGVGLFQLMAFKKESRIKFTYKVDEDFANFLNNPDNLPAKNWLLNDEEIKDEDLDELRQLLDEMEAIYSLMKKGVIDDDIFYDSLSYYVEALFFPNKKPTCMEYIQLSRDDARKNKMTRPDEIYIGLERMRDKILRMAEKRPPEPDEI